MQHTWVECPQCRTSGCDCHMHLYYPLSYACHCGYRWPQQYRDDHNQIYREMENPPDWITKILNEEPFED